MITILGPTAVGKTHFAVYLAQRINGEIISADSRQVYRRMNVGTGKDYDEFRINGTFIPVHLIDVAEPGEEFNVYEYKKMFVKTHDQILSQGKKIILCGGSGMYIEAVLGNFQLVDINIDEEFDKHIETLNDKQLEQYLVELKQKNGKVLHNHTDLDTRDRLIKAVKIEYTLQNEHVAMNDVYDSYIIGIRSDRETILQNIKRRLLKRLNEERMIEEVQKLMDEGVNHDQLKRYGLEYKFITKYLLGEISYDQMVEQLNIAINQFSKRQMTWFRRMERRGYFIHWVDANRSDDDKFDFLMKQGLNQWI